MSSSSSDTIIETVTITACALAIILLIFLISIQTDSVSRRIFSPSRLRSKRRKEQRHTLERSIAEGIRSIRFFVNGGVEYEAKSERCITDVVREDWAVEGLVEDIVKIDGDECSNELVSVSKCCIPLIVAISLDLSEVNVGKSEELFAYLAYPEYDVNGRCSFGRRVQTPLIPFATKLAAAFHSESNSKSRSAECADEKMCTISSDDGELLPDDMDICFVADASSGLGTRILTQFVQRCNNDPSIASNSSKVVLIKEPAWMTVLAYLVQVKTFTEQSQSPSQSQTDIDAVLYALCKLHISAAIEEEICCQLQLKKHHHRSNTNRTTTTTNSASRGPLRHKIVITLPGQSSTATLLPILYRLFPNGTFLFSYDRCVHALTTGLSLLSGKSKTSNTNDTATATATSTAVVTTADDDETNTRSTDYTRTSPSIAATIPISLLRNAHVPGIETALATLSARHAGIIETWMTSVDSYLSLAVLSSEEGDGEEKAEVRSNDGSISTALHHHNSRLIPIDVRTLLTTTTHSDTSSATSIVDIERDQIIKAILPHTTNTTDDASKTTAQSILIDVTNAIATEATPDHVGLLKREEARAADRCAAVHEGIRKVGDSGGVGSRRFLE